MSYVPKLGRQTNLNGGCWKLSFIVQLWVIVLCYSGTLDCP